MNQQERAESRVATLQEFNESDGAYTNTQIFGLPFSEEQSEVILIPVPWEVTVSYRTGTANGPEAIRAASSQIDLFNPHFPDIWKYGFAMQPSDDLVIALNDKLRPLARACMRQQENHDTHTALFSRNQQQVNEGGHILNRRIYKKSLQILQQNKIVGIVGGDHSAPLGLMQALANHYASYGILHIDAHFDHREAFDGFTFSHASIMRNASYINEIKRIAHVGIRDYCKEEAEYVAQSNHRCIDFLDVDIAYNALGGNTPSWHDQCRNIINRLPRDVYISFDIDGLDPKYCPHTGTPVPGGLEFYQAYFLIKCLADSGRRIIGFDLCEVAPAPSSHEFTWAGDWNAIVGARILYLLCSVAAISSFDK